MVLGVAGFLVLGVSLKLGLKPQLLTPGLYVVATWYFLSTQGSIQLPIHYSFHKDAAQGPR